MKTLRQLLALAALPILSLFTSCCTSHQDSHQDSPTKLTIDGKPACAVHRIPLITVAGFEPDPKRITIIDPSIKRINFERRYPNAIPLDGSLVKNIDFDSPTRLTYCPKCEAMFEKLFAAEIAAYNTELARRH